QLETMVRVFGRSGLRNAYRSVLSAVGSSEISGASRWLDAWLEPGPRRATKSAASTAPTTASRMNAQCLCIRVRLLSDGRSVGDAGWSWPSYAAHSPQPPDRFGLYRCRGARRSTRGPRRRVPARRLVGGGRARSGHTGTVRRV